MSCPSEELFAVIAEGEAAESTRSEFYGHLESCDSCRQLLTTVMRSYAPPMPAEIEIGEQVDQYRLEERIGQGSMGVVFRACDAQGTFAIKIIARALAGDARAVARFEREARAAGRVDHPNVGALLGTGQHRGLPYLVMPFYEGKTLAQRLHRGPVPLAEAIDLLGQIAAGLGAAHAAGIIHRDVKPANVFLTRSGLVKVLDFGLAKPVHTLDLDESVTLSLSGETIGTLAYMAPEQLGGQSVDARSDLWAVGVIGFEMVTGRRPSIAIRPLGNLLPEGLARVVQRCLQHDPDSRYSSAGELVDELRRLV